MLGRHSRCWNKRRWGTEKLIWTLFMFLINLRVIPLSYWKIIKIHFVAWFLFLFTVHSYSLFTTFQVISLY
jgi:hypothetical protein